MPISLPDEWRKLTAQLKPGGQKTLYARNYSEMLKRQRAEYERLNGAMQAADKSYPLMLLRQVVPFVEYWGKQVKRRFTDTSEWDYESPEDKRVHEATIRAWTQAWTPIVAGVEAALEAEGAVRTTATPINPGEMPELWNRTRVLADALDSNFPGPIATKIPGPFVLTWWHDDSRKRGGRGWGDVALALVILWALSES